jgi:5'(3')-deoxyribonucleotidase
MIKIAYIDMDGVIANWERWFEVDMGYQWSEFRDRVPDKAERIQIRLEMVERKMYQNLEVLPDAKELVDYVISNYDDYTILSACGKYSSLEVSFQKQLWLETHFPELLKNKPNFVTGPNDKSYYASHDSILIDDHIHCITPFINNGGQGILHTSTKETIKQLKQL